MSARRIIYSCSDVFDEFTDELGASCTVVVNSFLYLACFCCGYSGKGRCMERHPVWLFCVWARPRFLVGLLPWRRNASLAGGFAGRLVLVVALFGCDLDRLLFWYWPTVLSTFFLTLMYLSGPCHRAFTAKLEGKKSMSARRMQLHNLQLRRG